MRNRVTFTNLLAMLLFIGKYGELGQMATKISWWMILVLVIFDIMADMVMESQVRDDVITGIRKKIEYRRLDRLLRKEAAKFKKPSNLN